MVRGTSTILNVDVTFEFHFILLQVKKAQFGHFKKYGVNPKKKMKSFLVTRNALLHPGKKAIDTIDKKKRSNVSDGMTATTVFFALFINKLQ